MFCVADKKITYGILTVLAILCIAVGSAVVKSVCVSALVQPVRTYEWGLHFEKEKTIPVPNLPDDVLNRYNAYFHGNTMEKVIYITFDAGYENGYTASILDALKKHNVPAAFFLVGPYIEENPELVKRMVEEGHTVGNHSYNHPDMTTKTKEEFTNQLNKTAEEYKRVTGQVMPMYYRPPEGKFTEDNLLWAQQAGYTTVLWSSAYVDWDNNDQPSHSYAFEKIDQRTFNGAIFLLHSTSRTNAEILDQQIARWKQAGYSFAPIDRLSASYQKVE